MPFQLDIVCNHGKSKNMYPNLMTVKCVRKLYLVTQKIVKIKLHCRLQVKQNWKPQLCPKIIAGLFTDEGGINMREIRKLSWFYIFSYILWFLYFS